ncbi:hypothetical protein HA402_005292 [Bradysia odoriphaga]|nr:hypothetical protein HA402_005292 [Bradysia odoriphaga]
MRGHKESGGKRVNYSLAFSYSARVAQAVVQFNTKGHSGSVFHELFAIHANNNCRELENARIKHYAKNEEARQKKPRKRAVKDKNVKAYGPGPRPDLNGKAFENAKNIVLDTINTKRLDRDAILAETFGQKYNAKWGEKRKKLVNCSYFGRIINSRSPASYKNLVFEILYTDKEFGNSADLRHQRLYESTDTENVQHAASPIRLYGGDSIVSVQCTVKAFNKTVEDALAKNLLPYFKQQNGVRTVNKKSSWYVEAQGQLHITGRSFVYLVAWLGAEFTIEKVPVDHEFWKNQMVDKLTFFYTESMLKEVANPRKARKMELREYDRRDKCLDTAWKDQDMTIAQDMTIDQDLYDLVEEDYDGCDDLDYTNLIEIEDVYDWEPDQFVLDTQEILNENQIFEHEGTVVGAVEVDESSDENFAYEIGEANSENAENLNVQDGYKLQDETAETHRTQSETLSGRRIVDVAFVLEQKKYLYQHSDECDSQMVFTKETKLGFRSIFHFQCSECGVFHKVQTSSKNDGSTNVNKSAALGITSIGSGFYHLQELCAHLEIPCMSSGTFDKQNKEIQKEWWEAAMKQSERALEEEMQHAIATGNVDSAGNCLITVICDGSWGKRSYGKGFSSLSGCAVIIGEYTKKVVYFDAKNKYCNICTKSYAKFCPTNDHPCNINYAGPSSGMETEIIVEGFQACAKKGARFNKLISDGDSSTVKGIREICIYENPDLIVEKIECLNHLFKNFNKNVTKTVRNVMSFYLIQGDDICVGIRKAAEYWRESTVDYIKKLEGLERDCINAPHHYFGIHDNCGRYFCQKTTTNTSKATYDTLKSSGIFHEILNYCKVYFASNIRSLLVDRTTNPAEEFNNLVAKYLGGKRINYSLAFSYSARVAQAVVQFNTKGHFGSVFHELFAIHANNNCRELENARIKHYAKNEEARQKKLRKRAVKDKNVKAYGPGPRPDLNGKAFENAKNIVLDTINTKRLDRDAILAETFGQKYNAKWGEKRKKLVNCSYFGRIINSRSPASYKNLVFEILYTDKEFGNSADLRHQRLYESTALKMFSMVHKEFELEQTGLFIDKELGFLAASPIRLYGGDSIVSVQCTVKAFNKTVEDALAKNLLPYFKQQNGVRTVNKKSSWYVEAQGQLHITGRSFVYLVAWLGAEFTIEKVPVDHEFWKNQMVDKLTFFYTEAMLKEVANPRKARKMELREYDRETNTFI